MKKTANLNSNVQSAANMQAMASFISSGLQDFGWVKTADTGQCNPATLPAPTTAGQVVGFEIFRMADPLQGVAPVFMKLSYGCAVGNYYFALTVEIGTGTDGAGAITGGIFGPRLIPSQSNGAANACYLTADSSRFGLAYCSGGPSHSFSVWVERTKQSSGLDASDGVLVFTSSNAGLSSQYCPFTGYTIGLRTQFNLATPPGASGATAPNMYVWPIRCWTPGETSPAHGVIAYIANDFQTFSTYSVLCWDGVTRTYLMLGVQFHNVGYGSTNYIGMRYE